jgi:hypothetical protein
VAASASGGRGRKAGVVNGKSGRWTKTNRKVGKKSMERVRVDRVGLQNASCDGTRRSRRGDRRRDVEGTFQRVVGVKDGRVIGGWTSCSVGKIELVSDVEVLDDKKIFVEAGEAIDVSHHPCRTMEDLEEISKKLLRPTADLMDGAVVFKNLLDGAAIAEPEEFRTPKEFTVLADGPASAASFTDK